MLQVGHHMEVEGVPADFECAWRTAAMAHAKKLQPFLSSGEGCCFLVSVGLSLVFMGLIEKYGTDRESVTLQSSRRRCSTRSSLAQRETITRDTPMALARKGRPPLMTCRGDLQLLPIQLDSGAVLVSSRCTRAARTNSSLRSPPRAPTQDRP
eukprot:SAG31_NODE_7_length_42755_cov_130.245728_3_plen_153_part_00